VQYQPNGEKERKGPKSPQVARESFTELLAAFVTVLRVNSLSLAKLRMKMCLPQLENHEFTIGKDGKEYAHKGKEYAHKGDGK